MLLQAQKTETCYEIRWIMDTTISAIYEQGAFHLLEPLELPESTMVQVHVLTKDDPTIPTSVFQQYVTRLRSALPQLARKWSEEIVHQTFIKLFRDNLQTLWYLSPSTHRDLCAMLILATQNLPLEGLSIAQIEAIRFVLNKIEQEELTELAMAECHEKLLEADLFLSFDLDNDALKSYLDEF